MTDRKPLAEIANTRCSARKIAKVYGKQKGGSLRTLKLHREIFCADENDLEQQFDQLKIAGQKDSNRCPDPNVNAIQLTKESRIRLDTGSRFDLITQPVKSSRTHNETIRVMSENEGITLQPLLDLDLVHGDIRDFQKLFHLLSKTCIFVKLGEGSFADAYRLDKQENTDSDMEKHQSGTVLKIIPFATGSLTKEQSAHMTHIDSVTREIRILSHLSPLHGFARCRGVTLVRGRWPKVLDQAFVQFQEERPDDALNEHPRKLYTSDQLFAIIEMDDAGQDLARISHPTASQAYDAFWMTVILLANAERDLEFEHRDLHLSNLCFQQRTSVDERNEMLRTIDKASQTEMRKLGLSGFEMTIIDYTLSRANLGTPADPDVVYDSMRHLTEQCESREGLDAETKMQLDTYERCRKYSSMRADLSGDGSLSSKQKVDESERWSEYMPKTNVFWLGFLVGSLILRGGKGRRRVLPGSTKHSRSVQSELWHVLDRVSGKLNQPDDSLSPASAQEVLEIGVKERWLTVADINHFKASLERDV